MLLFSLASWKANPRLTGWWVSEMFMFNLYILEVIDPTDKYLLKGVETTSQVQ